MSDDTDSYADSGVTADGGDADTQSWQDGVDASGGDDGGMALTGATLPDDGSYGTVSAGPAVWVGERADGTTMTAPTWGGDQPHVWHEGHSESGRLRSAVDQQGNVVSFDTETGRVTTAMKMQDLPSNWRGYSISQDDLPSFDE